MWSVAILALVVVVAFTWDDYSRTRAQDALPPAPPTIGLAPYGSEVVTFDLANKILTVHLKRLPQNAEVCIVGERVWCGIPAEAPALWAPR